MRTLLLVAAAVVAASSVPATAQGWQRGPERSWIGHDDDRDHGSRDGRWEDRDDDGAWGERRGFRHGPSPRGFRHRAPGQVIVEVPRPVIPYEVYEEAPRTVVIERHVYVHHVDEGVVRRAPARTAHRKAAPRRTARHVAGRRAACACAR